MVDPWLLILTLVGTVLVFAINIYLFVLYSHPDDNKDLIGWIGWIIVITGSAILFGLILVIPLDIANSRGSGGGLNMDAFYQLLLILNFLFVVFLIPVTIFLYESDEDDPFITRLCRSLCYEIFLIIIVIIFSFIAYWSMRNAELNDIYVSSYT